MKWLVVSLLSALASSAVSFSQAFAATPGQAQWTVKRTLMKDTLGRYYYSPTHPDYKLARVNVANGSEVWAKTLPEFAYFDINCSESDRIFVYAGKKLQAINPDNGQTYWTYTHEGNEAYTSLTCLPRSNEVFISYGENSDSIKAIGKWNGQEKWKYTGGSYSYIFNSDWQNFYISKYENGVGKIVALNHWNGAHHWTQDVPFGGFWAVDQQGRVYITGSEAKIQKLAPWDGSVQWTFQGEGDYSYLLVNDAGVILAQDARRLVRLNPDNGSVQWTHSMLPPANGYVGAYPLKSGDVVVRTTFNDTNTSKNLLLSKDDGRPRWENQVGHANGYITEDGAQQIYSIEGGKKIMAFDRNNGKTRWTYDFPGDVNHFIFQIFGQGENLYATYGAYGKYPPMGVIRLNAGTGTHYWNSFLAKTLSIIGWDDHRVLITGYMTGESSALQR